jgi:hypothetical protein
MAEWTGIGGRGEAEGGRGEVKLDMVEGERGKGGRGKEEVERGRGEVEWDMDLRKIPSGSQKHFTVKCVIFRLSPKLFYQNSLPSLILT